MKGLKGKLLSHVRAAVALIIALGTWIACRQIEAQPASDNPDSRAIIAAFQGDTLDDLARLLQPWAITGKELPSGTTLYLRDAVYAGAANGEARIVGLWLSSDHVSSSSLLLRHQDAAKNTTELADNLAQGPLHGSAFAVVQLAAHWQDWKLTIRAVGKPEVRAGTQITPSIQAIFSTSGPLRTVDTRSISIPIGYGETKLTDWMLFFEPGQVIIRMLPTGSAGAPLGKPDLAEFGSKAGFAIGDTFLNNVFSSEYKSRIWSTDVSGNTYRAQNVSVAAQPNNFQIKASLLDVPNPATASVQLTLKGDDLAVSKMSAFINCNSLPLGQCLPLQGKINGAVIALNIKFASTPQHPIKPDGVQSLGNFSVGGKPLYGIAKFDRLQASNGAALLLGTFRFQGGQFQ